MKNYKITATLTIAFLITVAITNFSCTKPANVAPQTPDIKYDVANKLFRVDATAGGAPFTITVTQIRPNVPSPFNFIEGKQNTEFNYAFSPQYGDTIKVVQQSNTGKVLLYVSYIGEGLGPINTSTNTTGGTSAELDYVVNK